MKSKSEFECDLEKLRNNTIVELDWSFSNPSPVELKQLLDALEKNTSLKRLDLFYNDFSTQEAAEAISELLKKATRTLELYFYNNNFGPTGATAIASGLATTEAQKVYLAHNDFGPEGAAAIGKALAETKAQFVDLGDNNFGAAGAAAIGKALAETKAQEVILDINNFGAEGAAAIGKALAKTRAQRVTLTNNNFGPAGTAAITQGLAETEAQFVDLGANNFGSNGAAAIGKALAETRVQRVTLTNNNFGPTGAAAIAEGLAKTRAQQVDLSHNNFGPEAAAAIGKALAETEAQFLDLGDNNFGAAGAAAIGKGLATTQAQMVYLSGNNFDSEGNAKVIAILRQKLNPHLEELMLDSDLPQDILDRFLINRERRIDRTRAWTSIAVLCAAKRAVTPKPENEIPERNILKKSIEPLIFTNILKLAGFPSRQERDLEKVFGMFSKGVLESNYKEVQAALLRSAELKKVTAEAPNAIVNILIDDKKALDIIITRLGLPTDKEEEEHPLPKDDLNILQALLEAKCGGEEEAIKLATTYGRRDIIDLIRQFQAAENERYQEAQRKKAILYAASQHQNPPAAAAIACAPCPAPTSLSTQDTIKKNG